MLISLITYTHFCSCSLPLCQYYYASSSVHLGVLLWWRKKVHYSTEWRQVLLHEDRTDSTTGGLLQVNASVFQSQVWNMTAFSSNFPNFRAIIDLAMSVIPFSPCDCGALAHSSCGFLWFSSSQSFWRKHKWSNMSFICIYLKEFYLVRRQISVPKWPAS